MIVYACLVAVLCAVAVVPAVLPLRCSICCHVDAAVLVAPTRSPRASHLLVASVYCRVHTDV